MGETADSLALTAIFLAMTRAATPLIFAALGEVLTEKSGVLNLGVEGMMLVGAVAAFGTAVASGSLLFGLFAAMVAGLLMAALFALLTQFLMTNQVATGLALTIFGVGLSAFVGKDLVGQTLQPMGPLAPEGLQAIPLIGPLLFGHDPLVYLSLVLAVGLWWFFNRSRPGLVVRAVGESPQAAHAIGYPVRAIRTACILLGGAFSGLAGAYLSLVYTPMWVEGMTAGRGWIALALVVFATWRPLRLLVGAYLFGGISILQLHLQSSGAIPIPSQVFSMLPYLATIVVLALISRDKMRLRLNAPASLGKPFHPES
jgi:simple sugar transport system permease protein